jgi:hypothetical protein
MILAISRPFIEERFQTFTVGLDYNNENHTLQHTPSNGPRYIGYPSDEIDDNWNALAKSKSCGSTAGFVHLPFLQYKRST